jgi:hypothetical protein
MSRRDRFRPSSKVVLGLGMANALILTLFPDPAGASIDRPYRAPSPGTKAQIRQVTGGEKANAVQTEGRLSVRVSGKPGRHIGIFWGQNAPVSSFQLVPGMSARIGLNGSAELVLDLASLPARRFYLQLVCADGPDFRNARTMTEAVEVQVRPQRSPLIAGSDASGLLRTTVSTFDEGSLMIKGGGSLILSLPQIRSEDGTPASDLFPKE